MRDRFFWGPRRVDQYCCHGEDDLLLRCFYFTAFHAVLEMRSINATGGEKNQLAKLFTCFQELWCCSPFWRKTIKIQSLLSGRERPVIPEENDNVVKKMVQLCPLVSLGLLNESWNRFFSRWHLHQGVQQLATLCRISFPEDQGKTLYWMQVKSVLSSCLGKRPLQTSCLSEALTSSALIALTGSSRLFISPFSQNHHCDWFEGDWSLAVWSIQPTVVKMDTKGIPGAVCVCYVTSSQTDTKWQRLIMSVFLNMVAICTLM